MSKIKFQQFRFHVKFSLAVSQFARDSLEIQVGRSRVNSAIQFFDSIQFSKFSLIKINFRNFSSKISDGYNRSKFYRIFCDYSL